MFNMLFFAKYIQNTLTHTHTHGELRFVRRGASPFPEVRVVLVEIAAEHVCLPEERQPEPGSRRVPSCPPDGEIVLEDGDKCQEEQDRCQHSGSE